MATKTLTNKEISLTYPSLIKLANNKALKSDLVKLTDGIGNEIPLEISDSKVKFTGVFDIEDAITPNTLDGYHIEDAYTKDELDLLFENVDDTINSEINSRFTSFVGNDVDIEFVINHNLNSKDVIIMMSEASTNNVVWTTTEITSPNSVTLKFCSPRTPDPEFPDQEELPCDIPTHNQYKITIIK
jgi:hypothetical protein